MIMLEQSKDNETQSGKEFHNNSFHQRLNLGCSLTLSKVSMIFYLTRVLGVLSTVNGLSIIPSEKRLVSETFSRPKITYNMETTEALYSWTDELLREEMFVEEVTDFHELQHSIGSEVVESVLQRQIDESRETPDLFLDKYVENATDIEKFAMASIPQQLPKPALTALTPRINRQQKKKRKSISLPARITHEEELKLAKQIQKGVILHRIKTEFEEQHGHMISKTEWAEKAGLNSTRELRKHVSDYRMAKQKLVESNLGLVHAVVRQRCYQGALSFEELVQEGSLGLLRAAELFDPNRGLRFSTYATIWIKGVLQNSHMKETITLPQREKTKWNRIRRVHDALIDELQRQPTHIEIAEALNLPKEEIIRTSRRMDKATKILSLDRQFTDQSHGGSMNRDYSPYEKDKAMMSDVDLTERTQLKADIVAALAKNLDSREARIMRLRYGLSDGITRSLQECANEMGISKSYVQRLASSALMKLRKASDVESLEEYFLTIA
mmetsp:Transcript_11282/g.12916  ORF Transcript_11282/g.12916 Transcript_11282/m.12916 type:complete len:497 (+) Transcript_11282:126-1616(+)